MKNFNDTIENRTRDLPACSAVPQPTAPSRAQPTRYSQYFTASAEIYKMSEIIKYIKNILVYKLIVIPAKYQPR